jgi:hypothetical protein
LRPFWRNLKKSGNTDLRVTDDEEENGGGGEGGVTTEGNLDDRSEPPQREPVPGFEQVTFILGGDVVVDDGNDEGGLRQVHLHGQLLLRLVRNVFVEKTYGRRVSTYARRGKKYGGDLTFKRR